MTAPTSLAKKLGLKPNTQLLLLNAPAGLEAAMAPLPSGTVVTIDGSESADLVLAFVRTAADVQAGAPGVLASVKPGGQVWFAYPKKTSAIKTDISRDVGWDPLFDAGLRPVALVAVDDTWSAIRFRPHAEVKSVSKPR